MVAIIGAIGILNPACQTRSLIIEKYAAILHRRLTCRIGAALYGEIFATRHRHVRPVIPWRHTYLLRQLIDTVYGAASVAAGYDQSLAHTVSRIFHHSHYILLAMSLELTTVELALRDQTVYHRSAKSADYDYTFSLHDVRQRGPCAAHSSEIFRQIGRGYSHSLVIPVVDTDRHRL